MRLRLQQEDGFSISLALAVLVITSLLLAVTAGAVNQDINLTRRDLDTKRAQQAAQAGISDYAFHLTEDSNYWTNCTSVPGPSAVNQMGSTTNRRPVGDEPGVEYAIELIPAQGQSSCDTNDAAASMIEQSGLATGTFRIRATGYAGNTKRSIVATFKRAGFLDFLYFTQLETSDPETYPASSIPGAYQQCTKTVAEGRLDDPIPGSGGNYCNNIYFISGETIGGPLHTNDRLAIYGSPTFGRDLSDTIEVSSPPPGWTGINSPSPNFVGTFITNAPVLTPPPTNGQLAQIADPSYKFEGQVHIALSGNQITVTDEDGSVGPMPFPSNGVIYVSNGTGCSSAYSPFTATYEDSGGCGNAYVSGDYSGRLTVAAENDVVVEGDLNRQADGMLGLISNNFVRVMHQFDAQTGRRSCNGGSNGPNTLNDVTIDAAILAINHSFIVDHYDCGASLGTLEVNGAIAQRFRGAVGTFGSSSTGYLKDYNYDDRLRFVTPPHFLDPVESAWHVQRQTLDFSS